MKDKNIAEKALDSQFAKDVLEGLTAKKKFLSSKYFYDKRGDELFQEIMAMPEYYLTRSEFEILTDHKDEMLQVFSSDVKNFSLIEFGAGDGLKTKVLLQQFWTQQANFSYHPVDISTNIVEELTSDLEANMPGLKVEGISADYFRLLESFEQNFPANPDSRKVIFFLGANIGNYSLEEAIGFLQKIRKHLDKNDLFMIGMDLKKNPELIYEAYNDKQGITAEFNLNLLTRINRELDANFDLDQFQFFPLYDPMDGSVRSYLVSKTDQEVALNAIDEVIHFDAWEAIYMEKSQKFSLKDIDELAAAAGFQVVRNFFDARKCFTDSLWKVL